MTEPVDKEIRVRPCEVLKWDVLQMWRDEDHAWLCLHTGKGRESDAAEIEVWKRETGAVKQNP